MYQRFYQASLPPGVVTPCADLTQLCPISHTAFSIYTDHQPSTLVPFLLTLKGSAQRITVSFTMQNMDMGPNQYELVPNPSKDKWQGRIILPACLRGRRDWHMVIYKDNEPIGQVAFYSEK